METAKNIGQLIVLYLISVILIMVFIWQIRVATVINQNTALQNQLNQVVDAVNKQAILIKELKDKK